MICNFKPKLFRIAIRVKMILILDNVDKEVKKRRNANLQEEKVKKYHYLLIWNLRKLTLVQHYLKTKN